MWPNPQETADLFTFTEEILNGKLYFLCNRLDTDCMIYQGKTSRKWLTDLFLMHPFPTPWKHQKTYQFFNVFREEGKGTLGRNELVISLKLTIAGTGTLIYWPEFPKAKFQSLTNRELYIPKWFHCFNEKCWSLRRRIRLGMFLFEISLKGSVFWDSIIVEYSSRVVTV